MKGESCIAGRDLALLRTTASIPISMGIGTDRAGPPELFSAGPARYRGDSECSNPAAARKDLSEDQYPGTGRKSPVAHVKPAGEQHVGGIGSALDLDDVAGADSGETVLVDDLVGAAFHRSANAIGDRADNEPGPGGRFFEGDVATGEVTSCRVGSCGSRLTVIAPTVLAGLSARKRKRGG